MGTDEGPPHLGVLAALLLLVPRGRPGQDCQVFFLRQFFNRKIEGIFSLKKPEICIFM